MMPSQAASRGLFFIVILTGLALGACGGGSGESPNASESPAPTEPEALTAVIIAEPAGEAAPLTVRFDGSRSSASNGRITSHSWSFGDGATGAGAQVEHEFPSEGSYTVSLTVTNGRGNTDTTRTAVAVGADPLYSSQWHLDNHGQTGGTAGADIRVASVWESSCGAGTCRGQGVRIAVVDDGLEISHEDLAANVVPGAGHDYLSGGSDPSPRDEDAHGTAVAGIVAARDLNGLGGRGVAPRAELVGYNVLKQPTTVNQADAMVRDAERVHVSVNSWGAPDGTGALQPTERSWQDAIETGLTRGREGRGTIYVWAGGNGAMARHGLPVDNSNYDGQANFYGIMAVGALDHHGRRASYSEPGANLWLAAPGGGGACTDGIVTTDLSGARGLNNGSAGELELANYTRCLNGTSAAAPMVAGVAALVLQVRPELSWRDLKLILAESARRTDADDEGWQRNGAGRWVHHGYGFGAVDAQAAVNLARTWTPLSGEQIRYATPQQTPNLPITDGGEVTDTLIVSGSGIRRIEFVEIYFSADHPYPGDLEIVLSRSSANASESVSVLAEARCQYRRTEQDCRGGSPPYADWRFGSARHLYEAADGAWQLTVRDRLEGDVGVLQGWRLVFYGH